MPQTHNSDVLSCLANRNNHDAFTLPNFANHDEVASLVYTGIDRHDGEDIGLYDTVLKRSEYQTVFEDIREYEA